MSYFTIGLFVNTLITILFIVGSVFKIGFLDISAEWENIREGLEDEPGLFIVLSLTMLLAWPAAAAFWPVTIISFVLYIIWYAFIRRS